MKTLTLLLFSLFSLPLMLNAQTADEMLHKVTAAIEAGQHGQAVSYFRQAISLNIDRSEMFYWTSIDKSSEISRHRAIKSPTPTERISNRLISFKSCCP